MMCKIRTILAVASLVVMLSYAVQSCDDCDMHPKVSPRAARSFLKGQESADYWITAAQARLRENLYRRPNVGKAKNVIMFLGDGMSFPTLAASRVVLGQSLGTQGEETSLYFEKFPYSGLSKTYCVNSQVADSACSATAYLGGVKANIGTIGVTAAVPREDCNAMMNQSNHVSSILKWSQDAGKSTGFVTTSRVTHASPAGTYAHVAEREWECDSDIINSQQDPNKCDDIAEQLILNDPGRNIKVIMGGGRREFRPKTVNDEEGHKGKRKDGVDLIDVWVKDKIARNVSYSYVWSKDGLQGVNPASTEYLLGLFAHSHVPYHLEPEAKDKPTLPEMTEMAIKTLQKDPNGFFLFVEGARIDMGHHSTKAHKALDETLELQKAVEVASRMTNEQDTLIVVTADHAHTMTFSGYPIRGNDIFGLAGVSGVDKLPYSTLGYANGPGYKHPTADGSRYDLSGDNLHDIEYEFPATSPLKSETHGGDDVGVFAQGPWSHLLTGSFEQNLIPHVMAYASCVGSGLTYCTRYDNSAFQMDNMRRILYNPTFYGFV